eukprot:CAMPEP_0119058796 /NCGR_PEP_ID=MMETSP1178-20130426/3064_1 /TAXON_ID=33656 /ORGANISM="unid sp, Strain CCMP2000" /LENGTH=82 /DNA_ID=CAMNT_0007039781 /DNA_START=97 /DNA_END=345 /DNA_ORIENTATION=-
MNDGEKTFKNLKLEYSDEAWPNITARCAAGETQMALWRATQLGWRYRVVPQGSGATDSSCSAMDVGGGPGAAARWRAMAGGV